MSLLCLLGFAGAAWAQTITDGSYSTVGYIKSDGTIQDRSYRTIGHIRDDGTVLDGSYRTIGHLRGDGTVMDGSYRTVGHIRDDGTVMDGSYRTIGHIRKDDGTVMDAWFANKMKVDILQIADAHLSNLITNRFLKNLTIIISLYISYHCG